MHRLWIALMLTGCTHALPFGSNEHDLAPPPAADMDAPGDAALADLAPAPAWQPQPSTTTQSLRGVWGSSASDVYAVGLQGTILHCRGDGVWTAQTSGTTKDLHAIWGSGPHDLYAAGDVLLHSRGDGVWTAQTSGTTKDLNAIWGSGPHDLYAAGDVLLHSTGDGTWTPQTAPSGLMGVWGSAANDLYVAGVFGISHSTGDGTWTALSQPEPWGGYFHARGTSATDVYAVGGFINLNDPSKGGGVAHLANGQWSWTRLSPPDEMKDIAFTSAGAFIVGLSGQIWAQPSGGSTFTQQTSPVPWDLQAVWADDAGTLWAVGGSGSVLRSSGDGHWTSEASLFALDLWGVWGSGAHDVYAVGDNGQIFHFD